LQFRKIIAALATGLTCAVGLLAATPQKKTSAHTKSTAAPAGKKPASAGHTRRKPQSKAALHTAHAPHVAPHTAHAAPHPVRNAPARSTQSVPTPERYKEIQEALARKGYLHGEASGVWNPDSADALRRFQQDQNLQASGKLDSLSIIALGLGPKY
jgi:hypothetical protein